MDAELEPWLDPASREEMEAALRREVELSSSPLSGAELHPTARKVERLLQADKPDGDWGCVRCIRLELPYVRVSPSGIGRAVALIDAMCRMFDARGWRWRPSSSGTWASASVEVCGASFFIKVEETARRAPHKITPEERLARAKRKPASWEHLLPPEPRWDFQSSNDFAIRHHSHQLLRDRANSQLETRLTKLPARLIDLAFAGRAETARRNAREAEIQRINARHMRLEELRTLRSEIAERLIELSQEWDEAERLRRFISAAEAAPLDELAHPGRDRWLAEARQIAARIDPLNRLGSIIETEEKVLHEIAEIEQGE